MAKYVTTESRYVKEAGMSEPHHVAASPEFPAVIDIDETEFKVKLGPGLKPYAGPPDVEPKAEKLKPAHAVKPGRSDKTKGTLAEGDPSVLRASDRDV